MNELRATYLATATVAAEQLGRPDLAERWHEPSALPGLTIGGLAAHWARSLVIVETYLDAPLEDGREVDAPGYFLGIEGVDRRDSDLSRAVVARAETGAEAGAAAVAADAGQALARLRTRLDQEPPDRKVSLFGMVVGLDEYLRTRLVELTVHADDLAVSLGTPPPDLPASASSLAVTVLVKMAIRRRGPTAVLRALTRRERDDVDALRVL